MIDNKSLKKYLVMIGVWCHQRSCTDLFVFNTEFVLHYGMQFSS